jgi:hypothetical protein
VGAGDGGRCHAYLAGLDGDLEGARAASAQALSRHERLPVPFELGRTLLVQGMIERQAGDQLTCPHGPWPGGPQSISTLAGCHPGSTRR